MITVREMDEIMAEFPQRPAGWLARVFRFLFPKETQR